MPRFQPVLLERKVLAKEWGGDALTRMLGLPGVGDQAIGESWELFDRPDESSKVRGERRTVGDLLREDRDALLGRGVAASPDGRFPLLLKFIDAHEVLSIQVHPDDAQAQGSGDGGKSEAWVVLQTGPKARVLLGVRPDVTKEQFETAAHTHGVVDLLRAFTPKVGDSIHIPAGTVHCVGPDVVVFEIQHNSDVTYRLYDWGRHREVHVQKALAVTRLESDGEIVPVLEPLQLPDGGELLVEESRFRLRRYRLKQRISLPTNGAFLTVTVTGGRGMLGWHSRGEDAPMALQLGDTALVPACIPDVYLSPIGKLEVLVAGPRAA